MNYTQHIAHSIVALYKKGVPLDTILRSVSSTLSKYRLSLLYPRVLAATKRLAEQEAALQTVYIHTPFQIDGETERALLWLLDTDKHGKVETHIQKDLLAGFTMRHNRILYDASAKHFISRLQQKV